MQRWYSVGYLLNSRVYCSKCHCFRARYADSPRQLDFRCSTCLRLEKEAVTSNAIQRPTPSAVSDVSSHRFDGSPDDISYDNDNSRDDLHSARTSSGSSTSRVKPQ